MAEYDISDWFIAGEEFNFVKVYHLVCSFNYDYEITSRTLDVRQTQLKYAMPIMTTLIMSSLIMAMFFVVCDLIMTVGFYGWFG